jgi:hypothetical protein
MSRFRQAQMRRIAADELAQNSVLRELQTLLHRSVLLRLPDLQDDLAGFVWCARKHVLRLARL